MTVPGYVILEELARGRRRVAWRAVRERDGVPVLLKTFVVPFPDPAEVAALERERELFAALAMPGVARPMDIERDDARATLVLEDPGGVTPAAMLAGGLLPLERALAVAAGLAELLAALHDRGIIHKDITPWAVLADPATGRCTLIDCHVAVRLRSEPQEPRPPQVLQGSLAYMSPEQTGRMNRQLDARGDLYSLGATLYHLFTGHPPFEADDPLELVHSHLARLPVPPATMRPDLPAPIADILTRLLAKTPDQRYQSAAGALADLSACLDAWRATGDMSRVVVGEGDVRRRFEVPRQLYGREEEVSRLLAAFDRTCGGAVELVMVSGYAGIGKTSLIRELYAPAVRQRGYVTTGKFDQIVPLPYGALIEAFRGLLQQLLSEDEAAITGWRARLGEALGTGAGVLAEVMPEVELLLGPQPPPPPLNPSDARNRFRLALQHLVGAVARQDHPLAIFLDDLQWADSGTLELLEPFLGGLDSGHLLVIGAYRDSEVGASHPLSRTIADLERAGVRLRRVMLGPLTHGDLVQMLGDTLRGDSPSAERLARLVAAKTAGNPFFVIQFLEAVHREGLLTFDPARQGWTFDTDAIGRAGMTDNVIELMARRIDGLGAGARNALTLGACIGNRFDLRTLAIVRDAPQEVAAEELREALDEGLLLAVHGPNEPPAYAFLHDRVQHAAYTTIPAERTQAVHLAVGRLLLDGWDPATADERLFDIVHHLNRGRGAITAPSEALTLARLDLAAARRAMSSTAFDAARGYLAAAIGLLPAGWDEHYALLFELHLLAAECEYVAGEEAEADRLTATLLQRAGSRLDRARVYRLQVVRFEYLTRYDDAIAVGREALALFGLSFPEEERDKEAALEREDRAIAAAMAGRSVESLVDLPTMADPETRALMQLLASLHTPCYLSGDKTLTLLNTATMVRLSLEHGNTEESALAYVLHAMHIGPILGQYEAAYDFGRLALALGERLPDAGIHARVLMNFSWAVSIWRRPMSESFQYTREAFRLGNETGMFSDAGYALFNECYLELLAGPDLRNVAPACEANVEFLRRIKMDRFVDGPMVIRQWALALQGRTDRTTSLDDADFGEDDFAARHQGERLFLMFRDAAKLALLCTFGEWSQALAVAEAAAEPLTEYTGTIWDALRVFHQALALARCYPGLSPEERGAADPTLDALEARLARWADNAPANFGAEHLLVRAEIARAREQPDAAMALYEAAIDATAGHPSPRTRAMANELCGRFWRDRGQPRVARVFMTEARAAWRQWGASAKVHALEAECAARRDSTLEAETPPSADAAEPGTLDSASVLKATGAIAGEIDLGRLVGTLLRVTIENVGAERGALLVERDGGAWLLGEGTAERVDVHLGASRRLEECESLPHRICNFVRHTRESVLLDDASADDRHGADPYVARWQPRSVMCVPALNRGRLVATLYLENNLATGVFSPARLQMARILAAQASVSLVNAQLYETMRQEIEERNRAEQKLRAIARGTAAVAAGEFFTSLVQHLAGALGLRYAFLSECEDERRTRVRTLAFWNGTLGTNFAFDLAGTPCRNVIDGELAVYPENLQALFPQDKGLVAWGAVSYLGIPLRNSGGDILGHLAVLDDKPFHPKDADIEILRIFGARAGTELERKRAEDALRASEQELRAALATVEELKDRLQGENVYLQEQIDLEHGFEEIIGRSKPILKVLRQVERVAPADTTVLITGETGTGKELVARAIHKLSPRGERTMITVNCGAISPTLVESELFGHEKGAFTGAVARKIGRFEMADGGTIFLDEIGDLPLDLQVKLLRVLQEGEFERVGAGRAISVNVRVIAATHRNLEEAVERGTFRADLFYRLNVFPIHTPALRERKEDIPPLVHYFVRKYGVKLGKPIESIPRGALDTLSRYNWPGNVRELANILERSVIVSRGDTLELGDWIVPEAQDEAPAAGLDRALSQITRQRILEALEETGWRVSGPRGAAQLLGLKATTLEARMRRLDIRRPTTQSS